MITIQHGDDISSSRSRFYDEKKNAAGVISFDDNSSFADIQNSLQSSMLFTDEKSLFIENFLSKRKPSQELTDLIDLLNISAKETIIYLWESKELTKKQLSLFPKAKVEIYNYPKVLFTFLDSFRPQNNQLIALFHQTLEHTPIELILFMLQRHIRLLLSLKDPQNPTDEINKLPPWQEKKLLSQANYFDTQKLIKLYTRLMEIDMAMKSGGLPASPTQAVDFFLIDL